MVNKVLDVERLVDQGDEARPHGSSGGPIKRFWTRKYPGVERSSPYFSLVKMVYDSGDRLIYPLGIHRAINRIKSAGQRNAVFIWIPKTAGTSLWRLLDQSHCAKHRDLFSVNHCFCQRGLVTFVHMSYPKLRDNGFIDKKFDATSFKFCFVRNPFDRLVSIFYYQKRVGLLHRSTSFDTYVHLIRDHAFEEPGLFNVDRLSQCNSQLKWITDDGGIFVDFIGRFENLEHDVNAVCRELGVKGELPVLNKTPHRPYRDHYNAQTRALVEEVYRDDLEAFSYVF